MGTILTQKEIDRLADEMGTDKTEPPKSEGEIKKRKHDIHTNLWSWSDIFRFSKGTPMAEIYAPDLYPVRLCPSCHREFDIEDSYLGARDCPFCCQRLEIEIFFT